MATAQDTTPFETSDTSLAAWLYYNQAELLNIKFRNGSACFIFQKADPAQIEQFQAGQAMGNVLIYYRCYRTMIKMLHKAKNEEEF